MKEFIFEMACVEDAERLASMSVELWKGVDFEEEIQSWKIILNDESDNYCLLVKANQEYIGFLHVGIRAIRTCGFDVERAGYLESIFIYSHYRNIELAKQMLFKAEQWLNEKGVQQLISETDIDDVESQKFYQGFDFIEFSKLVHYIKYLY